MKTLLMTLFTLLLIATVEITPSSAQDNVAQDKFKTFAFDSTSSYVFTLVDGTKVIGTFLGKTTDQLFVRTASIDRLEIAFSKIKSITIASETQLKKGIAWISNPNPTRYFFAPSAYNLKKGEGYYQNSYLFLNSVNYGLTDYFSIGGSLELISTFTSISDGKFDPIFLITPKVGFNVSPKLNVGAGALIVSIPNFEDEDNGDMDFPEEDDEDRRRFGAGIGYGLATYGDIERNVTLGVGFGFFDKEFAKRPIITLNGLMRVGPKMALVTENWMIPVTDWEENRDYFEIVTYGVRFFGEKLSVDLGFLNNRNVVEELIIGVPYVDFVVKF